MLSGADPKNSAGSHLFLAKANDSLVSYCECDQSRALVASPGQADCPWCGCGWLFICRNCRKGFTFAEAIVVAESWPDSAVHSLSGFSGRNPTSDEIEEWIRFMQIMLKGISLGQQYVYLDGWVIPAGADGIHIDGWHSRHDLDYVPQVVAASGLRSTNSILESREYWERTATMQQN